MAPLKRKSGYAADDFVVDDEDEATASIPPTKRSKNTSSTSASKKDDEGNVFWEISKARRVTISDFRGKQLVSIREYYEKDGKWLPGKKGISMTIEQYNAFVEIMPSIEETLRLSGASNIERPNYDEPGLKDNDDSEDGGEGRSKANHEATSDEEE